jgi:hypothetical protein
MRKNLRTVKTGIIFGILLMSLFIAFVPTTSAGIVSVPPLINVTYPAQEENIVPNGGVLEIPLSTTFTLTGFWASFAENGILKSSVVQIELKVIEKPDWCEASISNPLAQLKIGQVDPYQSRLTLTVNENAPAFQQGTVRISATSKITKGLFFNIGSETVEFDISFIIGYWCVVTYELPQGTLVEVGPLDTADFQIDIQNIGNGPTYVGIEILDIPKDDWSVSVASSVQLASPVYEAGGTEKTVHLKIKPPYGFGFHNERRSFRVRFTPYYLGLTGLVGQPETITFNVQNIGMSPGAGYEIPLIVSVVVIIVLFFYFFKQRKK